VWTDQLTILLTTKKNEEEIKLVRSIIRLLLRLLNDENCRNKLLKELKPSGSEDWGLRTLIPTCVSAKKEWNGRFYMNS
jgi:hypothetical protein